MKNLNVFDENISIAYNLFCITKENGKNIIKKNLSNHFSQERIHNLPNRKCDFQIQDIVYF